MSRDNDQKRKESPHMEMSCDTDRKRKESPYIEMSRDNRQKSCVYRKRIAAPKSFVIFFSQKNSLLSATGILSRSPRAHNSTSSLDKLTCTDYVDFGKCQVRFGQFFWSKKDSNYLAVKLNVIKKDDNKEFRLVENLTMGEADFKQFTRLKTQLVIAAENYAREKNFSPVLIPTDSKDKDEQLKLAHKVVDVWDRAKRKICVTLLRYNMDKPDSSHAQVRFFASKKEEEKFQQIVSVN